MTSVDDSAVDREATDGSVCGPVDSHDPANAGDGAPPPARRVRHRHLESQPGPAPWPAVADLTQLIRPAAYFLISRIALLFSLLVLTWLFPTFKAIQALGGAWDAGWYIRIAQSGYPHHLVIEGTGSRWAFMPGYPAMLRVGRDLTGLSYPQTGILLGLLFGTTSAVAVWLAVREVFGRVVADRAVLLFVFFPTAYVLSMSYTEGLFITASALCICALSRRWWLWGAGFAIVASVTRSSGILLVLAVWVTVVPALRSGTRWRAVVAAAVAPLGLASWMAYSWHQTGSPTAYLKAEQFWGGAHFVWLTSPMTSVGHLAGGIHSWRVAPDVLATLALVFMAGGLGCLVWARRDRVSVPAAWWVFAVGSVLAAMSAYWPTSILRYSMAAFPLYGAIAWRLRPSWSPPVVAALAMTQAALGIMLLAAVVYPQATLLAP